MRIPVGDSGSFENQRGTDDGGRIESHAAKFAAKDPYGNASLGTQVYGVGIAPRLNVYDYG